MLRKIYSNQENKIVDKVDRTIIEKVISKLIKSNTLLKEDNLKLREEIEEVLKQQFKINSIELVKKYKEQILYKINGYDFIQKYINDKLVSDIRLIEYNRIYIKKNGNWKRVRERFKSKPEYENFIYSCIIKNGGKISYDSPIIVISDKKYKLRIEVGIQPVNIFNASMVIRIHRDNENMDFDKLLALDVFDEFCKGKLKEYVIDKRSILISGKSGSGKTTLMKAIINSYDNNTSMISNEETAELYIKNKNIIQREVIKNENMNINLELLTRQALVSSNDIMIVGEIKDGDALSFIDSITTGHTGIGTIHSNNAYTTINRLAILAKRSVHAQNYNVEFLQDCISSSLEVIIYMKNFKINEILEVNYDYEKRAYSYIKVYECQK